MKKLARHVKSALTLAPLTPEQALRIALNTPLPEKARKRQERKRAKKK